MAAALLGALAALLGALVLVMTAGPASAQRGPAFLPVASGEAPDLLDDGDADSLRQAIRQSLGWLSRQPAERTTVVGSRGVTVTDQVRVLRRMLDLLADGPAPAVLHQRVLAEFDLVRSAGSDDGTMLVTGYHEPIVAAAETAGGEYRVPVLGVPRDLNTRRGPYWTRAEIEQGRSGRHARPLAWARDPVDVYFMEIEGGGTLRFADGRELRVGYAATNSRPYRSVGLRLIHEGKITREAMTMRTLRDWLTAYPEERARLLRYNESYVFFRALSGGPVGSLGVPLTPGRTIATDPRIFPRAGLAFIRTERPVERPDGSIGRHPLARFVLSQDAGGVIRGPGRVDIYWGRGADADLAASDMKESGDLYLVVPKERRTLPLD